MFSAVSLRNNSHDNNWRRNSEARAAPTGALSGPDKLISAIATDVVETVPSGADSPSSATLKTNGWCLCGAGERLHFARAPTCLEEASGVLEEQHKIHLKPTECLRRPALSVLLCAVRLHEGEWKKINHFGMMTMDMTI